MLVTISMHQAVAIARVLSSSCPAIRSSGPNAAREMRLHNAFRTYTRYIHPFPMFENGSECDDNVQAGVGIACAGAFNRMPLH